MSKNPTIVADDGNWARAIREAIAERILPKGSRLGGRSKTAGGNFPRPDNAVGTYRARAKEYFWIVCDR